MVSSLFSCQDLKYDTVGGTTGFGWIPGDQSASRPFRIGKFLLTARGLIKSRWIDHPGGYKIQVSAPKVNCYDMTAALIVLAGALGISVRAIRLGQDLEHNRTQKLGRVNKDLVRVIGHLQSHCPIDFDTHVCAISRGLVFDASLARVHGTHFCALNIQEYLQQILTKVDSKVIAEAGQYDVTVDFGKPV